MADIETIELVKDIDVDKYKYGFETNIDGLESECHVKDFVHLMQISPAFLDAAF